MKTIYLKDICGVEVLSRANVRKLYDIVDEETKVVDLKGVAFISRSVADELCNIGEKYSFLEFTGLAEDVVMMLDIVRKGRGASRNHTSKAKVSMTFNCLTMDDLRKALSFGL